MASVLRLRRSAASAKLKDRGRAIPTDVMRAVGSKTIWDARDEQYQGVNALQRAIGNILTLLVGLMPGIGIKSVLLRALGHSIDRSARVGVCLVWDSRLEFSGAAQLGNLNVVKSCTLILGSNAYIGSLCWIAGDREISRTSTSPLAGVLRLDSNASVTARHFFDVSGGVKIGSFATVAGGRSTFITHGIDANTNSLVPEGVEIGPYALVGSNVAVVPGAVVPARSVVAMGSTVVGRLRTEYALYAGTPARQVKEIAADALYFRRTHREVEPRRSVS